MTSTITLYSSTIDVNYPVAGINQSSQGFRDNFSAIQSAFTEAATEVSNLQSKLIIVSGDVVGTSAAFGTDNSSIALALVLPNIITGDSINTLANNFQATINAKGQITSLSVTPISNNIDTSHPYSVDVSAMGSGTGTANFPTFRFDGSGKLVTQGTKAVTFGLLGHPATKGQVLAGGGTNLSALTPSPAAFDGSYVLTATGIGNTGVEWKQLVIPGGTLTNITAGSGIAVTQSGSAPIVSLKISALTTNAGIHDADSLPYYNTIDDAPERILMSDFKSYISQSFLSTDLGTTPVYSSSAGGVLISSTGGITLNGLKWPTTTGTQGQVLTISTGGNLVWSGSSSVGVTKTYFVSNQYGSDTTGTGGMTTPYQTITKALTVVPNDGSIYTIALLAGTYPESFTITPPNLIVKGLGGVSKPILNGVVSIGPGTTFVGLENLKLDRSAQPTSDLQPALFCTDDVAGVQILDCDFIRGSGAKALNPIITVSGNITSGMMFDGCAFQGQVQINFVATGDARTVISNVRQLGARQWGVTAGGGLLLQNIPEITTITHTGGELVLDNVGKVLSSAISVTLPNPVTYSWTAGAPDYTSPIGTLTTPVLLLDANGLPLQQVDGSSNPLYEPDGVTPLWQTTTGVQTTIQSSATSTLSVGIYSTSNSGALKLYDVCMFDGTEYTPIYKVGSAPYLFANVDRRADKDIILGSRITYEPQIDGGSFMPRYEADFNGLRYADDHATSVEGGKLDPTRAKTLYVTLVGSGAHLSLKTPGISTFNNGLIPTSSEFVTDLTVFVQQDATGGRTVKWSADTPGLWTDGYGQLEPILWYGDYQVDDAPNAITVYKFYYHSVAQQWIGMRTSKGNDRKRVSASTVTTFVPTLQHANGFISINNASAIAFQINPAVANFPVGTTFDIEQAGAGAITVTGLSGQNVFVRGTVGTTTPITNGQYAVMKLTKRDATTWIVTGDHS